MKSIWVSERSPVMDKLAVLMKAVRAMRQAGNLPVELEVLDADLELAETSRPICVQSITGYDQKTVYEGRRKKLVEAGFERLRSKQGDDKQCTEVFYLPGAWAAKGECLGMNEEQIVRWVMEQVHPGTIELCERHWGLSVD